MDMVRCVENRSKVKVDDMGGLRVCCMEQTHGVAA